jgi:hypothetical protein
MSGMMQRWLQALPSPYQPGTGMGPGMMSGHDWAGMHRSAELALCRDELRAGASPQARHLAQAMLTERQAQLAPSFSAGTTAWTTPANTPGPAGTETWRAGSERRR